MPEHHAQELSHVGRLIYDYRTAHHLSRQEMADLIGVSLTTLNRIKTGDLSVNIDTAIRIASVLGITLEELVGLPVVASVPPEITAQLTSLEKLAAEQAATISAQQITIADLTNDVKSKETQISLYADAIRYHQQAARRNDIFCKAALCACLLITVVLVFLHF